jgi:hypothetical protein
MKPHISIAILLAFLWCPAWADSLQVMVIGCSNVGDQQFFLAPGRIGVSIFRNDAGEFSRLIVDRYDKQFDSARKTYSSQTWFRNGGEFSSEFSEDKSSYHLSIYSIYSELKRGATKSVINIDKHSKAYTVEIFKQSGSIWTFDRFGPPGRCREITEAKPL